MRLRVIPLPTSLGMRPFLAAAAVATVMFTEAEEFTGFVVDNYCWNKPGHRGNDGSQLGTAPEGHVLHCLWQVPQCKTQGYVMLEKLQAPDGDGNTYGAKYQLDDTGDTLAYDLFVAEQTRAGDRAFNELLTITGTAMGDGPGTVTTVSVSKICITPKEQNPSGQQYCFSNATTATSTTTNAHGNANKSYRNTTSPPSTTTTSAAGGATAGGVSIVSGASFASAPWLMLFFFASLAVSH